jgi:hypothetical protein
MADNADRGLLELSVALSKREITAGNEFALYVLVKNPFNKPIFVHRVNVSLPSELRLTQVKELPKEASEQLAREAKVAEGYKAERIALLESLSKMNTEMESLQRIIGIVRKEETNLDEHQLKDLESTIFSYTNEIKINQERLSLQEDQSKTIITAGNANINHLRVVSFNSVLDFSSKGGGANINSLEVYDPAAFLEQSKQQRSIALESSLPKGCSIQPSCTDVYRATLNVERSLIISPATYRLQFNVNFSFDAIQPEIQGSSVAQDIFINTISHELAIRPSIQSVMAGSAIGGLFGSLARTLQGFSETKAIHPLVLDLPVSLSFFGGLMLAMILSAVAIIFMARKSDTQSFVSVEDFWGGVLIGFLVGYTGTGFFGTLTHFTPEGAPKTTTPP